MIKMDNNFEPNPPIFVKSGINRLCYNLFGYLNELSDVKYVNKCRL